MPKWLSILLRVDSESGEFMSKKRPEEKHNGKSQAQAAGRRMYAHIAILVILTVGVFGGMALLISHSRQPGAQSTATPAAKEPIARLEGKAEFESLNGRWLRPDGGYVIDISEIDASGKMVARYYNPRPINVARAEASQEGTKTKVFIELRDINYPGSTYTLIYDPQDDQLKGVYFQAALKQSFDVVFDRMK
jgi:hypothetical protein